MWGGAGVDGGGGQRVVAGGGGGELAVAGGGGGGVWVFMWGVAAMTGRRVQRLMAVGRRAMLAMARRMVQVARPVLCAVRGLGGGLAETMARSPLDCRRVMRSARSRPAFS